MNLDYYYADQAEQFSFCRILRLLFAEERSRNITVEAKILYALLLDRMSLSARNSWLDKEGQVYIIYTVEDIHGGLGLRNPESGKATCRIGDKRRPH